MNLRAMSPSIKRSRFLVNTVASHTAVQRQPDKPAVQQIVVELLHQLQLRAHRIKGLQQQRAKQSLRRNRRPAELGVELLEFRRQSRQRLVHDPPDRPQWMILWDSRLAAHIAEQCVALRIPTAHRTSPTSRHATPIVPQYLPKGRLFPDPARAGGSGWAILAWSERLGRLVNRWAAD